MPTFDSPSPAPEPGARLAAHYATQLVAAAGVTLLEPDPSFHYSSTTFDPARRGLVGAPLPDGRQASLGLGDLILSVGDDSLPLLGRTPREAVAWLSEVLSQNVRLPEWDMPAGPTLEYPALEATTAGLERLAHWYAASFRVLDAFAPADGEASPLRVWPHHFDLATLVTLDASDDPEQSKSVGLGMTPGDAGIPAPYLYVTPWPYPEGRPTPALPSGRWNTDGWYGAVLDAEAVSSEGQVAAFLSAAFGATAASLR